MERDRVGQTETVYAEPLQAKPSVADSATPITPEPPKVVQVEFRAVKTKEQRQTEAAFLVVFTLMWVLLGILLAAARH